MARSGCCHSRRGSSEHGARRWTELLAGNAVFVAEAADGLTADTDALADGVQGELLVDVELGEEILLKGGAGCE
jgi:hypothetical protein